MNLPTERGNIMTKIKAYELSKGFVGISGKEIVKILSDYGISEKSHMSALDERELDIIFEYLLLNS